MIGLGLTIPQVAVRSPGGAAAPLGYRAIAIGSSTSFLVVRIGAPASWQTPVIPE